MDDTELQNYFKIEDKKDRILQSLGFSDLEEYENYVKQIQIPLFQKFLEEFPTLFNNPNALEILSDATNIIGYEINVAAARDCHSNWMSCDRRAWRGYETHMNHCHNQHTQSGDLGAYMSCWSDGMSNYLFDSESCMDSFYICNQE